MNRRTRLRIALASTLPTALVLPVLCLLAALGTVPWSLLLAVPVALALLAAFNFATRRGCSGRERGAAARR